MFVSPNAYKDCLAQLIEDEEIIDVAVAFWGGGAETLFTPYQGKSFRIICNLMTGGSNPDVIQKLRTLSAENGGRIRVRQCDRLHAKVIIGAHKALVGSANISTNGLGLEASESGHWLEAGVLIEDDNAVANARDWFNDLWESELTCEIHDDDIQAAKKIWNRSRHRRDLAGDTTEEFDLTRFTVAELKDRPAYALLYRSRLSNEANECVAQENEAIQQSQNVRTDSLDWWPFETWPVELSSDEPLDYLGIYYCTNGKVIVDGICRMVNKRLEFDYVNEDDGKGWVDLALPTDKLLDRPFGGDAIALMTSQLKSCIREVWSAASGEKGARRIHISDLARIVQASQTN